MNIGLKRLDYLQDVYATYLCGFLFTEQKGHKEILKRYNGDYLYKEGLVSYTFSFLALSGKPSEIS